jgi:hypothetical protein
VSWRRVAVGVLSLSWVLSRLRGSDAGWIGNRGERGRDNHRVALKPRPPRAPAREAAELAMLEADFAKSHVGVGTTACEAVADYMKRRPK